VTFRHTPYCLYVTVATDDTVDSLSPSVSDAIATKTADQTNKSDKMLKYYIILVCVSVTHSMFCALWRFVSSRSRLGSVRRH